MVYDKSCIHDGYSYLFIRKKVTFHTAKQGCESVGGLLLKNFDQHSILKLESCLSFNKTAPAYWVGLKRTNNCSNSSFPYRMVHNNKCVSQLTTFVSSSTESGACTGMMLVQARASDAHAGMREQACNQKASYACQFVAKTSPTTSALPSTAITSTSPIVTDSTPIASTVAVSSISVNSLELSDTTATTNGIRASSKFPFEHMFYIGAAAVLLALLIAVSLVYLARKTCSNKRKQKSNQRTISEESTTTTQTLPAVEFTHQYYSIGNPDSRPEMMSAYYVYRPSMPSTSTCYTNLPDHYEQPSALARRALTLTRQPYVYMELDNPDQPTSTVASSEDNDLVSSDYTGDYIMVSREIQTYDETQSNDFLQSTYVTTLSHSDSSG